MGSFQTVELIETFINYQESIKRCITIIYDPQRSALGGLAIKVGAFCGSLLSLIAALAVAHCCVQTAALAGKHIMQGRS